MGPVLRPEEARRALYIDFEGGKDQPPVLLGCARRNGRKRVLPVWQAITDTRLRSLAEDDELECLALADAVERILQRAEKRDRLIVAWTTHELDVVRVYCPEHLDRFESRYVNALGVAKRWRNSCHGGQKPAIGTLAAYLDLIGHRVPDGAGPGRTGETIRILLQALASERRRTRLTDNQRRRWGDLREHNRNDCVGMRKVCLRAADEMAARPGANRPGAASA
jgi:hypothetical protein